MTVSSSPDLSAYQPNPDGLTEPFWKGASEGFLVLTRCVACRRWQHPPLDRCRVCAEQLVPERAPAFGRIYSYTTTYHPAIPLYEPPYVVAVVEIGHADEPPRIVVRLVDCQPGEVKVGAKVLIETRPLPGGPFSVPVALLDRDGQG